MILEVYQYVNFVGTTKNNFKVAHSSSAKLFGISNDCQSHVSNYLEIISLRREKKECKIILLRESTYFFPSKEKIVCSFTVITTKRVLSSE